ncbi:MAG: methyltransferase [Geminicoccaceae bacterium]
MSDAPARLRRLITGYRVSQALRTVAELGIADLVAEAPRSASALAAATGVDPDRLERVLRLLEAEGVLAETGGAWRLTELGEPLRTDAPQSMHWRAINDGQPMNWRCWEALPEAVRSGQTGCELAHGRALFGRLAEDPAAGAVFDRLMAEQSAGWGKAVADAYPLAGLRTVVDVGGGRGALLAALLRANPEVEGVLFDQPHVVPDGEKAFAAAGLAERTLAAGGDFFAAVPPGGDLYLLKQVLHDWDDERCRVILGNCREAMTAEARLLIVEVATGPDGAGAYANHLDVHMMVLTGGRERSVQQYTALLEAAGLQLTRTIPTACELLLIEARPA